jgi:hypothetical protein
MPSASTWRAKSGGTTTRTRDDVNFDSVFEASAGFGLDTYWTQTPAQVGFR